VRIWDIDSRLLCDRHLVAEHSEGHAVWSVIVNGSAGYRRHPEVRRWRGKLRALYRRHEAVAAEMAARGFRHASLLDEALATGAAVQDEYVDPPERQIEILGAKGCRCLISGQASPA
jgi:pyrimidine dimer DNA glycosylase